MKITAEIEVTYDQNALNEEAEASRSNGLDEEEIKGAIAGALLECEGIENLAGVEVKNLTVVTA